MKLFQKLIAVPAVISMSAGFAVNAAEINSTDLNSYSNSSKVASMSDFKSNEFFPGDWTYESLKELSTKTNNVDSSIFNGKSISRIQAATVLNSVIQSDDLLAGGEGLMNGSMINRLSDELGSELAIMKGRVDGLEARVNEFEAGQFSETTTMSGSAGFLIGATDSATEANDAVQFEYVIEVDLNTSFTGEDKLNIELEAGNGLTNVGADKVGLDWGSASSDAVEIDDINYTFPVGDWTVAVGDSMDASKTWPNACSMNNMVDNLGDCGAANSVDLSGNVSLSAATEFGDGWELGVGASGIAGTGEAASEGLFTKEGTDLYGIALGYETDSYGFTVAYSDKDTANYYGLVAYYSPEEIPTTFSGGVEVGNPDSGEDTTQWAFGISTDLGEGTLSANIGTNGKIADNAEEIYAYDLSYEYPINDSMSITPFVYISETTGTTTDTTGAGAFMSFSF
tara:strand:+ start:117 stop:1478 length:1362 start_codon:yes stop_codon:yes gene_type:complete